ncbi:iron uptake transporter deferrochelatase/peroxidase subunit [Methyloligella sp. 2.7D]|uniref:iron uptake transporter deferrochelatase/peroxidase subunit n=1 Tax=unclassified Methyloligella TaxID=2625955 RepID=UPI00157CA5B1|nr:iron uptake transporter deferrochelatase/peroxidase subunit [Methyloligella sp. GL2]QKP78119.1 deferrochelatase/peroxidase EfeB [Methyloligella sp. GL2]
MKKSQQATPQDETVSANRRQVLLGGIGLAAGTALAPGQAFAKSTEEEAGQGQVAEAPIAGKTVKQRVPFHGEHQAGIVTPRPANGIVASFNVIADDPEDLEALFRELTARIAFLTQGGEVPELNPKLPPADSGILGPVIEPDKLTVTVSLGASLFDKRPWLRELKPKQLIRMAEFPNDALDSEICHGDLALQLCANLQDTCIHALRDIMKNMPEYLVLHWMQEGNVPVVQASAGGEHGTARNFLGFHDGSANPNSTDAKEMDRIVWVTEDNGEPDWAMGGSYQAVRIIRNFVERWDRTPLGEQELIFGRKKDSGAPLDGGKTEFAVPDYAKDPDGKKTPLDSHIRLANPRTAKSQKNLILRRPFNYSNGFTKSGQLDQGLLFIVYQADLMEGFLAVQSRLNGEPLEEYIKPIGGGYFFVLPGARDRDDYLGRTLIEAIRSEPSQQAAEGL